LELRELPNDKLFPMYEADLILRIRNPKNLQNILNFLTRFKNHLGAYPPSPELAKGFLAQYRSLKPHTWYNYVGEMRRFMAWYGEKMDVKAKLPKSLPTYHEDKDVEALLSVIQQKKTHKKVILRDILLVELAWRTGLRRAELSNLKARDIHADSLIVRSGKGEKDRMIPLSPITADKLHKFISEMKPEEKVFKLNPVSLGMKIKDFAKRAGLNNFHCHSLRHKFCTDLLEKGADIRVVQQLMGHENLNTTQVYLGLTDKRLRDAVNLLDSNSNQMKPQKSIRQTRIKADGNNPAWVKKIDQMAESGENYTIKRDGSTDPVH
jgi:integrase/recombinase XerD